MTKPEKTAEAKGSGPNPLVTFHYVKGNYFRVAHADGVWGGPTPKGLFQMAFFSERPPIPREITYELQPTDQAGQFSMSEATREGKTGFVREMEFSVVMTMDDARSIYNWLGEQIKQFEDSKESSKEN